MLVYKLILWICLCFFGGAAIGWANPRAEAANSEAIIESIPVQVNASLDAVVKSYVNDSEFSGNVLVARHDKILLAKNYTTTGVDEKFLLASLTKQFVATIILRQVEKNQLRLDDPVGNFFKTVPLKWNAITVRHLLNHSSGIPDFFEFPDIEKLRRSKPSASQMLARIQDEPLLFPPGKGYSYSNSGYLILGLILEKVTGLSWSLLAERELWAPLGMSQTGVMQRTAIPGRDIVYDDPSLLFSVGDVYSNLEDLFHWEQAFFAKNSVLSDTTKAEMLTANSAGYGFGLRINHKFGQTVVWHTGHLNGHTCIMQRWLESETTIIVLTNLSQFRVSQLAQDLFQTALGPAPDFETAAYGNFSKR